NVNLYNTNNIIPNNIIKQEVKPQPNLKPSTVIKKKSRTTKKPTSPQNSCTNISAITAEFNFHNVLKFSRDQILRMTCDELEAIVSRVENQRSLSSEETKEVQRARRLIKN